MQPAGVGRGLVARIGDLDHDLQRLVRQAVFERQREGEGIDRARRVAVVERHPDGVRAGRLHAKGLEPREAVQAEGVWFPADAGAVARPADDRDRESG